MTLKPDAAKSVTNLKTVKKSSVKKKSPRRKKTRKKKQTFTAMYVLSIMILLSIILILASRLTNTNNPDYNIARQSLSVDRNQENKVTKRIVDKQSEKQVSEKKQEKKETVKNTGERNDNERSNRERLSRNLMPVKIYLSKLNPSNDRVSIIPVKRSINRKDAMRNTLERLIAGPIGNEGKRGFINSFPGGLKIRSLKLKSGILYIDFNNKFSVNAFGDIIVNRINLLLLTAQQFRGVKGITLQINGKKVHAMGGDGRIFNWPVKRRL